MELNEEVTQRFREAVTNYQDRCARGKEGLRKIQSSKAELQRAMAQVPERAPGISMWDPGCAADLVEQLERMGEAYVGQGQNFLDQAAALERVSIVIEEIKQTCEEANEDSD